MYDTRIRNGTVHTPGGPVAADVLVRDGIIRGIVDRGHEAQAKEEIDATGRDVIPGIIDLHAHTRTPGLSHKEDFHTVSQAAAAGGITSYVDMPNVDPPTTDARRLREKIEMAARDSIVDWGHFASGSNPDTIGELAEAGATGFKIFMIGGGYPHDDRIAVNSPTTLYRAFVEIAKTGLPVMVHPFNQGIFDLLSERELAAGKPPTYETRTEVYTNRDVVWRSAARMALEMQRETGVRLQLLHTHATGSLRLIREAKAQGQPVTCAIDPKYYHLTRADMERLGTRAYNGAWVTDDAERMALIWQSLADGTIDVIDSDHAPHTKEENAETAVNAWTAQGGSPQYDNLLSVLLNDVNLGRFTFGALVRLMSENPAKVIGVYPRKGALAIGSDADITIVDMAREYEINDEDLYTKVKWTPYLGWKVRGVPVLTMVRGTIVAKDGKVVGGRGHGRYLPGVPQQLRSGPVQVGSPGLDLEPFDPKAGHQTKAAS